MLAYHAWHLARFGALAPNTFYAKSSDSRWNEAKDGLAYVASFARTFRGAVAVALFALAPLFALARRAWSSEPLRRASLLASLACALSVGEVILGGGDGYEGTRFLAVPLALSLASLAIAAQGASGRFALAPVAALAFFAIDGASLAASSAPDAIAAVAKGPLSSATSPARRASRASSRRA